MPRDSRNADGRQVLLARLPIVSSFRELNSAAHRFLCFSFLNVVSWQCLVGPAMILLARKINMPPSLVGFLISFMPLSMLLVAGTVRIVTHVGPKRLMIITWFLRNVIASSVFLLPWALARWGDRAGWFVLLFATLGFCVVRAVGVGGWWPWLQELIPEEQGSTFFSMETTVVQIINVAVLLCQGLLLQGNPSLTRFMVMYAVGIVGGLLSLISMAMIPGGRGTPNTVSFKESLSSYRQVLSDKAFVRFVLTVSLSTSCVSWFTSASVLYMRDMLGLSSTTIIVLIAGGGLGVLATVRAWARFTDYGGSGLTMFKTLSVYSGVVLLYLAMSPGAAWTPYMLVPAMVLGPVFMAAFDVASRRALLTYVREANRVAHTNAWLVMTSLALGVTPILAGVVIGHLGLWGFRACFLISGVGGMICAVACRRVVADDNPLELPVSQLFHPAMPLRIIARTLWITMGMHESSRRHAAGSGTTNRS